MTRIAPILCFLAATAAPAAAQEQTDDDLGSLMERGMEMFLEGLKDEMTPALRDLQMLADEFGPQMRDFLREMGPAFATLLSEVEDWTRYEAPEMLENGDIIIRRKPAPEETPTPDEDLPPAGPTDI